MFIIKPLFVLPIFTLFMIAGTICFGKNNLTTKLITISILALSIGHFTRLFYRGLFFDKTTMSYLKNTKINHDFFHYYFGAKYPELGYLDFYKNTVGVLKDLNVETKSYRNLANPLEINSTKDISGQATSNELEQRMGVERFQNLENDLEFAYKNNAPFESILVDHGFNGTPFWIALQKINPFMYGKLSLFKYYCLISFDFVFLALIFILLVQLFEINLFDSFLFLSIILNIEGFRWLVASLSRLDWLLFLVFGFYFLKQKKQVLSGCMFAAASAIRIFPAVCMLPFVLALLRKKGGPDHDFASRKILMSFALTLGAFFMIGSAFSSWQEWLVKINTMFGSDYLVMNNSSVQAQLTFFLDKFHLLGKYSVRELFSNLSVLILACRFLVVVLWIAFWRNKSFLEQMIFWLIMIPFLFSTIQNYYFVYYLVILSYYFLTDRFMLAVLTLTLSLAYFGVDQNYNKDGFILGFNYVLFAILFLLNAALRYRFNCSFMRRE